MPLFPYHISILEILSCKQEQIANLAYSIAALQSFSNLHAAMLMRTETWHCSAITPCSVKISIPDAKEVFRTESYMFSLCGYALKKKKEQNKDQFKKKQQKQPTRKTREQHTS